MQEFDEYTIPKQKTVSFDFSRFEKPVSKATNNRASLIEPFVTKLNNGRVGTKYKPLTAGFIASKMAHVPTDELDGFYKKLDQSRSFCKLWWWYCNPKKK
jgi:hypothetical protein